MPELSRKSARREFIEKLFKEITFANDMKIPEKYKGTETEEVLKQVMEKIDFVFEKNNEIHSGLYTRIIVKTIIYEILYSRNNDPL